MISRKNRPTNGPGANHLRGGTRLFSEKTAVGGWIERSGGPSGYHRGFTTEEFETESQHQQNGINKPKFYGAGLPLDEEVEHPREVKDIFHPRNGPTPRDWKSNTHSMMDSVLVPKTEHNYATDCYGNTVNKNSSELEEYRASWTVDTSEGRKLRFNTESRRSANTAVSEPFQVPSLRLVPGLPNGFEKILSELTNRYGILGLTALRHELWSVSTGQSSSRSSTPSTSISSSSIISADDFKLVLRSCEVKLSRIDFSQVMAHLTTGETFSSDNLMRLLTPHASVLSPSSERGGRGERDRGGDADDDVTLAQVKAIVQDVFKGRNSLPSEDILGLCPEIERELGQFIRVYTGGRQRDEITREGFMLLHTDLYHSVPSKYKKLFIK